ncbi:CCR4-NOT core subunit cdc39 [Recurvomyces mirabilis]|uniref:CCR4-NOT core subunit cdc39 n=1 Tax=Recurvomyces mirabilis TaxID=574656 RepID=A0AAE1C5X0_9PEZI|nr:CCR4-NOT core subunit cdc39 [Recurvomyces mirabilis]
MTHRSPTSAHQEPSFDPTTTRAREQLGLGGSSESRPPRNAFSRHSSTSSSYSIHSPPASAYHATGNFLPGQRSRAGTGSPRIATSIASLSGASGPGNSTSRLIRHSPSLSHSTLGSPTSSISGASTGHLTSLLVTQLNILLSTLKESNYDTQAEKIRRLLDENGMELFETYFRRLLSSSWSQVFPHQSRPGSGPSNPESHRLLEQEVHKVSTDAAQAEKIAAALDAGDLDIDLVAFTDHFHLDPTARLALVLACRTTTDNMLRAKTDSILGDLWQSFLPSLANPQLDHNGGVQDAVAPEVLASIIERINQNPPRDFGDRQREDIVIAIKMRYQKLNARIPNAVEAVLYLTTLLEIPESRLARVVQRIGPRSTSSVEACKEMLAGVENRDISYMQVANALFYMLTAQGGDAFDAGIFVEALRHHKAGSKIDWTDVVQGFDREGLRVGKKQFLGLYNALVPLTAEYANFDIQQLWGGPWQYQQTQLSFVTAFLSTTPDELDVERIPRFRRAFTMEDYADAPDNIKAYAAEAVRHPLVSRDATEALFVMIFRSQDAYNDAQMLGIPETIINPNMTIFLCAASAVPKPWAPLQDQALKQLFYPFVLKHHPNYEFVMHSLWLHDRSWVAQRLVDFYQQNGPIIALIFEHAVEHGWLDLLLTIQSTFGVDLAAYAHSKGRCDLLEWAHPLVQTLGAMELGRAVHDFIGSKVEDETKVQKDGAQRTTVPLALKTVYALLMLLETLIGDEELGPLYRQCLQTYPRLFNYGDDLQRDALLERQCESGHGVPNEADAEMQERYKKMYGGEATPDDIVKELKAFKASDDPNKQDLFAAMLQGLFDEYNCFGEYPNEALATTAVLFGGLVSYNVLSNIAEQAAIYMIFEAVAECGPDDSMYRFGLQAMIHLLGRLKEWPHLAERILRIESLQNTPAFQAAQNTLRDLQQDGTGMNGDAVNGITNGTLDDEFPVDSPTPPFSAIRPDPPLRGDLYEEPNEDVSDGVMFALNNVSARNLEEKFRDLDKLEERHHQWFAHYLVEELAKSQPNFQALYLQLLETFDRKVLWSEVLRETYVSCAKMLNAPSTMEHANERNSLKNLGGWLGALTLARDQPILHRNLSFRDLLIEGNETQRLLVAIPFTCKALWHSRTSKVFRTPNPWLMELLGMLSELYHHFDLKLNLKFEIEVLCKDLGMDIKLIPETEIVRAGRPMPENNPLQPYVQDGGQDGFGDMHIMGLSKRPPNERFSPDAVVQALPDLRSMLHIPTAAGTVTQPQLREIFISAAQQAIYEIIAPVVERSVTIAAISTSELIQKDFATEADIEKLKSSAYTVVKALSGSLALVTCKEPLRMSITNNIRISAGRNIQEPLPEGQILMFVNDNIETVCSLVETAAEDHSLAEIDAQLATAIEERKRHNERRPNEPFNNPPVSRWAQLIPEPFKQDPQGGNASGLNRQQLGLYEEFGRQARITPTAHASSMSQDARGQLPDVLGDGYLPSMPTPAEAPAIPRPTPQQQRLPMQPPPGHGQVNGFLDPTIAWQQSMDLLEEILQVCREAPEEHVAEISGDGPIRRIFQQILGLFQMQPLAQRESVATAAAERCIVMLYSECQKRLEYEVVARVLHELNTLSVPAGHRLQQFLVNTEDDKVYNIDATVVLLAQGTIDVSTIDVQAQKAIRAKRPSVLPFLLGLFDEIILGEHASAMRADFAYSFDALGQWLATEPDNDALRKVMARLYVPINQTNGMPSPPQGDKRDQFEYTFEEWVRLQRKALPLHTYLAFVRQLYERHITSEPEDSLEFLRACLEMSCATFERAAGRGFPTQETAYEHIDALARLIAFIAVYQVSGDDEVQGSKSTSLSTILHLTVLIMNDHQVKQREQWNGRVYFRFLSTLLCEIHEARQHVDAQKLQHMSRSFGHALEGLQPRYFSSFLQYWIALLGHRLLVPALLAPAGRNDGSWDTYMHLLCTALDNLDALFGAPGVTPIVVQDFYRGVNRILLMLHHDFPEFLIERHYYLNSKVPRGCVQLNNLINSAVPRSLEQPDPFQQGLKINRLDQVRQAPLVANNIGEVLEQAGIKDVAERICTSSDSLEEDFALIANALSPADGSVNALLTNALVLYIGVHATSASNVFSSAAPTARLLERLLLRESRPTARHLVAMAMVNQVRYVNAHTHYFFTALQHMITIASSEVQEQVLLIVEERLMAPRPHPWGVIVMMLELLKNPNINIWDLPATKAATQISQMLNSLLQSSEPARMGRSPIGGSMM